MSHPPTSADDVTGQPIRAQFEAFLDQHRSALEHYLDGLSEEQVRRSLVPSRTTLLGLVKHATFVEKVWFDEAITCRSRAELGIPATPDESFALDGADTIASVQRAHREACAASRRATASLGLDDILRGNRRGPLPLRWVYLHVLRELAQHCGHADILREQILAAGMPVPDGVRVTRVIADLPVADVEAAKSFYTDYLGLRTEEFNLGWVARYTSPDTGANVQLVTRDAAAPESPAISVLTPDVDAAYAEAQERGYEIVHPLSTEPWGVRRFFVRAPDGTVVNIVRHRD
jgi:catechol 2,3-dioxygenase-like lactoylglutathione lyase family enzyme